METGKAQELQFSGPPVDYLHPPGCVVFRPMPMMLTPVAPPEEALSADGSAPTYFVLRPPPAGTMPGPPMMLVPTAEAEADDIVASAPMLPVATPL